MLVVERGHPVNVASTHLGDRVQVTSVGIGDNRVVVSMVAQGPGDPLCCPTHPEVRVYALQGDTLVPAVASDLVGIAWRWEGFLGGDDSKLVVDDPGKYTIEFLPTGSAAIRADCNAGRTPYRLGGPRLEIGPILLTRAACPPGSLGDRFVRYLADTVAYLVRDGRLILDVKLDTGQMRFSPARP